ncbi:anti-sigma factor domain-containing protein [Oceanobacillus senegalensis]|uniref:anti-sigma factor domain-containing protein n=1 Tax=Oceanobacillus senegalensis TaxID=1936063 RepID=UPI000A30C839|nr:anti-sigma factor domain-containing protein [Oceanobacillus senegalensis]
MKKGIILEKHRNYTIFLTKDGEFVKGYVTDDRQIGEEVVFEPLKEKKKTPHFPMKGKHIVPRMITLACICILLMLPFYFIPGTKEAYAYVTVDINPSVEIEIDKNCLVRDIQPLNDDAKVIIEQLRDYQGEKVEIVIQQVLEQSEEFELINRDKNVLVGFSFTSDEKLAEDKKVIQEMEKLFQTSEPDWNIAAFYVPNNIRKLALEKNTSMNKLMVSAVTSDQSNHNKEYHAFDDNELKIIHAFYNKEEETKDNDEEIIDNEEEVIKNDDKKLKPEKVDKNVEKVEVENHDDTTNEEEIDRPEPDNISAIQEKQKTNDESSTNTVKNKDTDTDKDERNSGELKKRKSHSNEPNKVKEKKHPSELKKKNGELNSNGKNKSNNGNLNERNKKHNHGKSHNNGNHGNHGKGNNGNEKPGNQGNNGNSNGNHRGYAQ